MYVRAKGYGYLMATLLMVACSQDEAENRTAPEEPVAISFACTSTPATAEENWGTSVTRATEPGYIEQLRYTGFGVFATKTGSAAPDVMYNQQVSYTYLADKADNGYWSYSPLKFWPNDNTVTFSAYAPYTNPADIVGATKGITSISGENEAPYITYKRFTSPNDSIDLLWDCQTLSKPNADEHITMSMRHALARLAVSIKLSSAPAAGTKVLVRRITLSGDIAESAKLDLTGTGDTPTWSNHVTTATTIYTDYDPETNTGSWGVIDNNIRYISELPYAWQPAGLNHTDYKNAISLDGHKAYIYLIPQSTLSLTCRVAYTIIASDGTKTEGEKVTSTGDTPTAVTVASPLSGNKSYYLKLILNI